MRKKLMVTLLLAAALLTNLPVKAQAGNMKENAPEDHLISNVGGLAVVQSVGTSRVVESLNVSEAGVSTGHVRVVGHGMTTNISVTMKLQRYDTITRTWRNVTQWTDSIAAQSIYLSKTYALSQRGSYRLYVSANVYCAGAKETVTGISTMVSY